MGLAPSENPEKLGKSVVAKVSVPIFSQPRCPAKVVRRSKRRIRKISCVPFRTLVMGAGEARMGREFYLFLLLTLVLGLEQLLPNRFSRRRE
jgi:hypothetical protein